MGEPREKCNPVEGPCRGGGREPCGGVQIDPLMEVREERLKRVVRGTPLEVVCS